MKADGVSPRGLDYMNLSPSEGSKDPSRVLGTFAFESSSACCSWITSSVVVELSIDFGFIAHMASLEFEISSTCC